MLDESFKAKTPGWKKHSRCGRIREQQRLTNALSDSSTKDNFIRKINLRGVLGGWGKAAGFKITEILHLEVGLIFITRGPTKGSIGGGTHVEI